MLNLVFGSTQLPICWSQVILALDSSILSPKQTVYFSLINITFGEQLLSKRTCNDSRNTTIVFSSEEMQSLLMLLYTQGLYRTVFLCTPGSATWGPVRELLQLTPVRFGIGRKRILMPGFYNNWLKGQFTSMDQYLLGERSLLSSCI